MSSAQKIAPNVYWLESRASNLYLCVDEDGLTLIDCGMPKSENLVWEALAELDHQPADINRILITHADMDHVGSTAVIQAQTGATVYASQQTAVYLPTGKTPDHLPAVMQFFTNTFFKYRPISTDVIEQFKDGDTLPILGGMQVLATPGHTEDHHSFFSLTTGVVFAGDALNTRNDQLNLNPPRHHGRSRGGQSISHSFIRDSSSHYCLWTW